MTVRIWKNAQNRTAERYGAGVRRTVPTIDASTDPSRCKALKVIIRNPSPLNDAGHLPTYSRRTWRLPYSARTTRTPLAYSVNHAGIEEGRLEPQLNTRSLDSTFPLWATRYETS
jgi:hypothetical protein